MRWDQRAWYIEQVFVGGGDYNLFGYFIRKTKNPNPSCGYRAVKGGGLPAYLVGKKQPES